jgi:hypothetical protein
VCVFVDRLSKCPISTLCHKTINAETARLFVDHVYRWVGLPESIVTVAPDDDKAGVILALLRESNASRAHWPSGGHTIVGGE